MTTRPVGQKGLPDAMDHLASLAARARRQKLAVFLDFDGTLTPIVERPEDAHLAPPVRAVLERLSQRAAVGVVSGRDLPDVQARIGVAGLFYAGCHGFDVAGPDGFRSERAADFLPDLDAAERRLRGPLEAIADARLERKRFTMAVHFRAVAAADEPAVERLVAEVLQAHPRLRRKAGKKVVELMPALDWDKGRAVQWLLDELSCTMTRPYPLFIGDDVTDEDAFRILADEGLGILVAPAPQPTAASAQLSDPAAVARFLSGLADALEGAS